MSQVVNQALLILGKLQVSAQLTVPSADKSSRWALTIRTSCGREALQLQKQFSVARSQQDLLWVLAEIQTMSEYAKDTSAPGMSNHPILNNKKDSG